MSVRRWTWSSILSVSRIILLIPFGYFLLSDAPDARIWAALVILLAVATDFLDGYLARARHEVTEFGKIIDPVADKIVAGVATILLAWIGDLEWWVAFVVVLRDILILIGGIAIRRKKHIIVQSNWPGKIAVTALAVLVFVSVLRSEELEWFRTATLVFTLMMALLSSVLYTNRLFIGRSANP